MFSDVQTLPTQWLLSCEKENPSDITAVLVIRIFRDSEISIDGVGSLSRYSRVRVIQLSSSCARALLPLYVAISLPTLRKNFIGEFGVFLHADSARDKAQEERTKDSIVGENDLLVIGPGVLGSLVGTNWLQVGHERREPSHNVLLYAGWESSLGGLRCMLSYTLNVILHCDPS